MQRTWIKHYGLKEDTDNIIWLMQDKGSTNALGKTIKPPFQVNAALPCNHLVNQASPTPHKTHWDLFQKLAEEDELVKVFLPVPKGDDPRPCVLESDEWQFHLLCLSRLSSPIRPLIYNFEHWYQDPSWKDQLFNSNIQPIVLTDCDYNRMQSEMEDVTSIGTNSPRRVLFVGSAPLNGVKRVAPSVLDEINVDLLGILPLEYCGSTVIRNYMRHNWPINPDRAQSRRPTPDGSSNVLTSYRNRRASAQNVPD